MNEALQILVANGVDVHRTPMPDGVEVWEAFAPGFKQEAHGKWMFRDYYKPNPEIEAAIASGELDPATFLEPPVDSCFKKWCRIVAINAGYLPAESISS